MSTARAKRHSDSAKKTLVHLAKTIITAGAPTTGLEWNADMQGEVESAVDDIVAAAVATAVADMQH